MADLQPVNNGVSPTVSRPKAPAPAAVAPTASPALPKDDYARPGVLGNVVTVTAIGRGVSFGSTGGAVATVFNALKIGVRNSALVAGAISVVTNGYDFVHGRENLKQFLGLSAADTLAYTGIAAGATTVAAFAVPALIAPVAALASFALPLTMIGAAALGIVGSIAYAKLGHEAIKKALQ